MRGWCPCPSDDVVPRPAPTSQAGGVDMDVPPGSLSVTNRVLSLSVAGFLALAACETKNAGGPTQAGGATGSGGQESSGSKGGGGSTVGSDRTASSGGAGAGGGATSAGGASAAGQSLRNVSPARPWFLCRAGTGGMRNLSRSVGGRPHERAPWGSASYRSVA